MKDLLMEYESFLLNNGEIPEYHFKEGYITNLQGICVLTKYLIEDIMRWAPDEAYKMLNEKTLKTFGIYDLMEQYVEFMPGISEKEKVKYVVYKCYPTQLRFDTQKVILRIYDEVLLKKKNKWSKKFFNGKEGAVRACICMQAAINRYLYGVTIPQLYEYFSNYARGMKFIDEVKLKKAFEKLYELPIDFLHYSLLGNQRDDFLYNYYRFMYYYDRAQHEDEDEEDDENLLPDFEAAGDSDKPDDEDNDFDGQNEEEEDE